MVRFVFTRLSRFVRFCCFFLIAGALCFTTFEPLPRTCPASFNRDTGSFFLPDYGHTLVAAHRVGKSVAPENTRMAVEQCLQSANPPDILETDIQITADGVPVLFHNLYLDKSSNAVEYFGREHVTVFSEKYSDLRNLNLGETFEAGGTFPYAGLRGEDIPEDLRILRAEDMIDLAEAAQPGRYRYVFEIKYPSPWAPMIVDKLYAMLTARQMTDRVIFASYWDDVSHYIDLRYRGKLMRSANPIEIIDFYGCFKRGADLRHEDIPFMALQMPYYWKNDRLLVANLGQTAFVDYAHKYGISVQYWTLSKAEDMQDLVRGGADVLMADNIGRAFSAIRSTELFTQEDIS